VYRIFGLWNRWIKKFNLSDTKLVLLNILLGIMLLYNSKMLPLYPITQWSKKPSKMFNTPLLKFLEHKSIGYRVNNLPYPVSRGQINKIKTVGYTGGNHTLELEKLLNLPIDGIGQYNWFDWKEDGKDLDKFGIKYHVGSKPKDKKWVHVDGFDNLWENTHAVKLADTTTHIPGNRI